MNSIGKMTSIIIMQFTKKRTIVGFSFHNFTHLNCWTWSLGPHWKIIMSCQCFLHIYLSAMQLHNWRGVISACQISAIASFFYHNQCNFLTSTKLFPTQGIIRLINSSPSSTQLWDARFTLIINIIICILSDLTKHLPWPGN